MIVENINIQLQDSSGNWRTFSVAANHPQRITAEMQALQKRFPDKRIRAVDSSNRIVDML